VDLEKAVTAVAACSPKAYYAKTKYRLFSSISL
jgi:hypothetical protein